VATVGSTSTTSIDPVPEIADLCAREGIWLHVDAAYAGAAAICPEHRAAMPGIERADSLVVNPHKWLFTPVDCSVLFVRDLALLKGAFSLVPEYLRTGESSDVTNLMDLGFQLGRRFRSLKLWMVIRAFGVEGLRQRIRAHCAMARDFAAWIEADPRFELAAPVPFSTVCFRARLTGPPEEQDGFNERLMDRVNAAGPFFLSHTGLQERFTLRVAIGNLRTEPAHMTALWELLTRSLEELRAQLPSLRGASSHADVPVSASAASSSPGISPGAR
jgi:aromatic-L-amino-acid decarboxylase